MFQKIVDISADEMEGREGKEGREKWLSFLSFLSLLSKMSTNFCENVKHAK